MAESRASKSQSQSQSQSVSRVLTAPPDDNGNANENRSAGAENGGSRSKEKKGRKNVKLPLVLWKTWLHRKHHWCCFACELITPVLLTIFITLMLVSVRKAEGGGRDEDDKDERMISAPLNSEKLVQRMIQRVFLNDYRKLRRAGPGILKNADDAGGLSFENSFKNVSANNNNNNSNANQNQMDSKTEEKKPKSRKDYKSVSNKFVIAYAPNNVGLHNETMELVQSILAKHLIQEDVTKTVQILGFTSEGEIEEYFKKWDLANQKPEEASGWERSLLGQRPKNRRQGRGQQGHRDSGVDEKFVGAFLLDFPKDNGEWSYTIRLHDEYYTSKFDALQFFPHSSRDTFPNPTSGQYDNFIGFQVLMDLALLGQVDGGASVANISLGELPSPPTGKLSRVVSVFYFYFLTVVISITYLCTLIQTVRGIASEKESGFKEILKVHGLGHWVNVLGWTFSTMFVVPFGATVITLTFVIGFLKYTDGFMLWITMFCYGLQIMAIGFCIASICTKALFATILALIVWLSSLIMGLLLATNLSKAQDSDYKNEGYVELGTAGKFFLSVFFPEVALSFAINIFMGYEGKGVTSGGSSWSNLYTPFATWDGASIGLIWTAMLVSIFFYIVLGTYLENILPSNYGARKPILYPFYKSTWCHNSSTKIEPKEKEKEKLVVEKSGGAFEPDPVGLTPGVSLYELTKVYGKKTVVDGVSLHIYQGQITILLGHNGAGKSTLVSMVTGLTTPTKGTAVIQGCDIRKDLDGAQQSMSICPQENMQASTFTVIEHLRLFALLKGSSFAQSKAQAEEWVQRLKLVEKRKTSARKLSGGMRRRLQLGMSLIGGNHVVFLDEPSSGLDPQTRREVWDILMNYRGKSTIVLSTHYMEEADVLGDRIVIMRDGQFQCCGSPLFLKGIYGIGYTLHVTINRPNSNPNSKSQNQTPAISPTASKSESQIQAERKSSKKSSRETTKLARRKSSRKTTAANSKLNNNEDNEQNSQILSLVKSHFPDARIVKSSSNNNSSSSTRQLDINIPQATNANSDGFSNSKSKSKVNFPMTDSTAEKTESESAKPGSGPENKGKMIKLNNASKFPTFFKDLESNSSKLGIAHSSLTFTTLDDVFEKAGAQLYSSEKEGENEGVMNMEELESIQVNRKNLGCRQFRAFLLKKLGITGRKWGLLVFQLLFPAIFMIFALCIISLEYSGGNSEAPLVKMSISDFKGPVTLFTSTSPDLSRHFKTLVGGSAQEITSGSVLDASKSALKKDQGFFTFHHILAADLKEEANQLLVTVYASQMAVHSQPLAINLATNTILKKIRGGAKLNLKKGYPLTQLTVKSQALRRNMTLQQAARRIKELRNLGSHNAAAVDILFSFIDTLGIFLLIALVPVVVTFVFVPAQEKVSEWKHLQVQMTGASPFSYWAAIILVDFCLLALIFLVLVALIPIFKAFDAYTPFMAENGLGVFFLILLSFGYSTLCMGYFASARAKSATSTITFFILFHLLILFGVLVITIFILSSGAGDDIETVSIFFHFFPSFNLFYSLHRFHEQANRNVACTLIPKSLLEKCPKPGYGGNPIFRCCSNCEENCIRAKPFLEGVGFQDVGRLILIQFAVGTFFLLLLILRESRVVKKCCQRRSTKNGEKPMNPEQLANEQNLNSKVDEDVIEEIQRVKMEVEEKKRFEEGDSFLVNQLSKAFRNFQAVKNVTFGVRKDQCFGLLGPNGCGKTTMFRMLAGQEIPDTGNAYINTSDEGQGQGQTEGQSGAGDLSCNLKQREQKFLSNIGYCPQFDAFSGYLTGKEMLLLMGRLRGIEEKSVSKVADQWLLQMGLEKSAKVQCRKYSGGMKRKLSAALSLIGSPKIVFLDEPSTGVDPHARRQFWKVLASAQKAGQSVILTSHSMEECEALCSSLCIMINGKMQCLGGVEHLKHKFAIGHDLTIKLTVRIPPRPQMQAYPNPPNFNPNQGQPPLNQNRSAPISNSNSRGQQGPTPSNQNISTSAPPSNSSFRGQPGPGPPPGPNQGPVPSVSNSYWNLPLVQELLKLKESIKQGFSPCILKDEHENVLQYQIQNTLVPWSTLFQTMEEIKERHRSLIQEYTLQETTLEQVFLSIARMQITREEAKSGCCKVCCLAMWEECCS